MLFAIGFVLIAINAQAIYKDKIRSHPEVSTERRITRITIGVFAIIYGLVFLLVSRFFLFL